MQGDPKDKKLSLPSWFSLISRRNRLKNKTTKYDREKLRNSSFVCIKEQLLWPGEERRGRENLRCHSASS